jgi:Fe-S cluster assembly protein SufD
MSVVTTEQVTGKILSQLQQTSFENERLRKEAFEVFQRLGIPQAKHEEYKHTPISRLLDKNFQFNTSLVDTNHQLRPTEIEGLDAHKVVFVNGLFSEGLSNLNSGEVEIGRLSQSLSQPDLAKHFGSYVKVDNDAMAAWNTAAWTDGVCVRVKANQVAAKPIVLYYVADGSHEVVTNVRNLFIVERGAQLSVVEKFETIGSSNVFLNLVNEAVVEENAGFEYYSLQNDSSNRYQHTTTAISQRKSSRVNTYTFTLAGKLFRNNLQLLLDGEGIESHMYGLYLLDGDTLADSHTVVDHMKPHSFSNELYKGIMDGASKGVFNGKIYVRPNAQKTNAFQANKNILLTDKAQVNTKPQLEIWADDVKCSHGCTTGQIDEEALFYLQSRGINKETAKAMMLYAFAGDVLEHVANPVLKEHLDKLISDRLHKNF